jgi:hypothetical protein
LVLSYIVGWWTFRFVLILMLIYVVHVCLSNALLSEFSHYINAWIVMHNIYVLQGCSNILVIHRTVYYDVAWTLIIRHLTNTEVRVGRILVFCVMFCRSLFVCPSLIYGFWIPRWYIQTFLIILWAYLLKVIPETAFDKHTWTTYINININTNLKVQSANYVRKNQNTAVTS